MAGTEGAITAAERATYEEIWTLEEYAQFSPGEQLAPFAVGLMGAGSVLDAGTGSGRGGLALKALGCTVFGCDLTTEGLTAEAREAFPVVTACLWQDLTAVAYLADLARRADEWPARPDVTEPAASDGRFDWVFCVDVLEHLPKEFVLLAVSRMLAVSQRGVFLSVANVADAYGLYVGRALHHTVEDFSWWRNRLREVGEVSDARDMLTRSTFIVRPRRAS